LATSAPDLTTSRAASPNDVVPSSATLSAVADMATASRSFTAD
jgi:hypothetical protein